MKKIFLTIGMTLFTSAVFAVGNPAHSLNAAEASSVFESYKPFLVVPGCPGAQTATAGVVTSGANPLGGSQTTTITMSGGATIEIVTSWSMPTGDGGNYAKSSTSIKCSL